MIWIGFQFGVGITCAVLLCVWLMRNFSNILRFFSDTARSTLRFVVGIPGDIWRTAKSEPVYSADIISWQMVKRGLSTYVAVVMLMAALFGGIAVVASVVR